MSRKDLGVREPSRGLLSACLVDGDPSQLAHARRTRRKALAVSLAIQASALAALLLVPLLATGEKISSINIMPVPPYYGSPQAATRQPVHSDGSHHATNGPSYDTSRRPTHIPQRIATTDRGPDDSNTLNLGPPMGPGSPWGLKNSDDHRLAPPPPPEPVEETPRVVQMSHMDPAMLVRRVEPVYPILAKMAHREGRVELHAIISTDGSIRALEVIRGDPLFIRASCDAVFQWRYRPLILNGQAVEVETQITVIFQLQR
ncbi:MAG TPA: energy transducer TonB [Candidatus Acidoferrales bacterium]|nr:energy transducer TonB [Candidatus Acidoferrales bacterium]